MGMSSEWWFCSFVMTIAFAFAGAVLVTLQDKWCDRVGVVVLGMAGIVVLRVFFVWLLWS